MNPLTKKFMETAIRAMEVYICNNQLKDLEKREPLPTFNDVDWNTGAKAPCMFDGLEPLAPRGLVCSCPKCRPRC